MCIYIYIYMYVYICIYKCIYIYIYINSPSLAYTLVVFFIRGSSTFA